MSTHREPAPTRYAAAAADRADLRQDGRLGGVDRQRVPRRHVQLVAVSRRLFGAAVALILHQLMPWAPPDATIFILAGMGAVAAGVVGAPMTMILLVLEVDLRFLGDARGHGLGHHRDPGGAPRVWLFVRDLALPSARRRAAQPARYRLAARFAGGQADAAATSPWSRSICRLPNCVGNFRSAHEQAGLRCRRQGRVSRAISTSSKRMGAALRDAAKRLTRRRRRARRRAFPDPRPAGARDARSFHRLGGRDVGGRRQPARPPRSRVSERSLSHCAAITGNWRRATVKNLATMSCSICIMPHPMIEFVINLYEKLSASPGCAIIGR